MAAWVAGRATAAEPASVAGAAFAIPDPGGWYPALVQRRGTGRCRGMLVALELGRGDLAWLDRYEGASYRRVALTVTSDAGVRTRAWTYLWHGPLPQAARRIAGGDFLAWLARFGQRPYAATLRHRPVGSAPIDRATGACHRAAR